MSRPLEFDALEEPACPRCAALTRDLAQARQALQRLSDAATTVWHQASVGTGYVTYNALEEIFEANAVAREALVERGTEQTDTGGDETSPVAQDDRP